MTVNYPRNSLEPGCTNPGRQQLSCNNNLARAITAILPSTQLENQGLHFKKWIPITVDEEVWMNYIEAYFKTCKTTDEEQEDYDNTSGYQNCTTAAQPNIPGGESTGTTETHEHATRTCTSATCTWPINTAAPHLPPTSEHNPHTAAWTIPICISSLLQFSLSF
jgi:hypothetical protein